MGVGQLRDAFNAVAQPEFTCRKALLSYENAHDVQWQVLTFSGIASNGAEFTVNSQRIEPHGDIIAAATKTAQDFVTKRAAP